MGFTVTFICTKCNHKWKEDYPKDARLHMDLAGTVEIVKNKKLKVQCKHCEYRGGVFVDSKVKNKFF